MLELVSVMKTHHNSAASTPRCSVLGRCRLSGASECTMPSLVELASVDLAPHSGTVQTGFTVGAM
jgi:hypothetical protein